MNLPLSTEHRARVEEFQRKHRVGLVTLLFTDMVGSTKLKQTLGDHKAGGLLLAHHNLIRRLLQGFAEGQEINTAGDSFFIVFTKPSDALKFSLLVQAKLRTLSSEIGHRVSDRIGIHVGEVFVEEETASRQPLDLYGTHVDTCARVMSLAHADQILLSRFAFDSARPVLRGQDNPDAGPLSWLNHGPYLLKGVEEPVEICEVGEVGKAALSQPADTDKAHRHVSQDQEPVLGWRPALGQVVPGTQWVLDRKLGEGGFGEVWTARHQNLKERRVYKFCFRADRVRSLKREVTLFRLLKERVGEHPNIVAVRDVFFDKPPFYIVMDFVEGQDLRSYCEAEGGIEKVPIADRLEIVAQISDALQAAHDAGIIHRDIKPSNILVSKDDAVRNPVAKLTDFGIGQVTSQELLEGMTKLGFTQTMMSPGSSTQAGTQMYMAPELLAGKPASPRSDIYSLGVVLFQLVSGDFSCPVTTDWAKQISDPLLREDLARCFAGNPQDRFEGAALLAKNLRALEDRRQAKAAQEAAIAVKERAAYRRGVALAASVGLLIIGIIAGLAVLALQQSRQARRIAQQEAQQRQRAADSFSLAQKTVNDLMELAQGTNQAPKTPQIITGEAPNATEQSEDSSTVGGFSEFLRWQQRARGDDLRLALAKKAVENYEVFVHQTPDDPALKYNLAQLYRAQGVICFRLPVSAGYPLQPQKQTNSLTALGVASLKQGRRLLEELVRSSPRDDRYQNELADLCALQAEHLDGEAATEALRQALKLREDLAAKSNSWQQQHALADLLALAATRQTNSAEAWRLVKQELAWREKLAESRRSNPALPPALSYEFITACGRELRVAEDPSASIPYLRRAIEACEGLLQEGRQAGSTNPSPAQLNNHIALLRLEITLATALHRTQGDTEGLQIARKGASDCQKILSLYPTSTKESLLGSYLDLAELFDALGSSDEAIGYYRRGVDILETQCHSSEYLPAVAQPLESVWDKMVALSLRTSDTNQAVGFAAEARDYWKRESGRWRLAGNICDSHLAAAWVRLQSLHESLSQTNEAEDCAMQAAKVQQRMLNTEPKYLLQQAQILCDLTPSQQDQTRPEWTFATRYPQAAIGVLAEVFEKTLLSFPEGLTRGPGSRSLTNDPNFTALAAKWQSRARPQHDEVHSVTDAKQIQSALQNDREVRLHGIISAGNWNKNKTVFFVDFEGVRRNDLTVIVRPMNQSLVETRLKTAGGTLEEGFSPKALFEFRGTPTFWNNTTVEIDLKSADQILKLEKPAARVPEKSLPSSAGIGNAEAEAARVPKDVDADSAGKATLQSGEGEAPMVVAAAESHPIGKSNSPVVIQVTNTALLKASTNQQVVVEGRVLSAEWGPTGRSVVVEFVDVAPDGFMAAIRKSDSEPIVASLGGDPAKVLPNKRVRLAGKLQLYPFSTKAYKGRPEILITEPKQIEILGK